MFIGVTIVTTLTHIVNNSSANARVLQTHAHVVHCCWSASVLEIQTKAIRRFVITEKAPTRAFSWLKAGTTAFTFKTLLRHYAKRALTPRFLNVKLGPRRKGHKGRAVWLA